jgi:hypothetical protein
VTQKDLWPLVNKVLAVNSSEGVVCISMLRFFSLIFAIVMGFVTVLLLTLGLSLGHVYMSMGCLVGSAVGPVIISILYARANGKAIAAGAIGGLFLAMLGWFIQAQVEFGEVAYETLMSDWPWVIGNLCALLGGTCIALVGCLIFPDNDFKWDQIDEKLYLLDDVLPVRDEATEGEKQMRLQFLIAVGVSLSLTFLLIVLWPIPQHLFGGVMGAGSFQFWVILVFLFGVVGFFVISIVPAYDLVSSATRTFTQLRADREFLRAGNKNANRIQLKSLGQITEEERQKEQAETAAALIAERIAKNKEQEEQEAEAKSRKAAPSASPKQAAAKKMQD